MQRLPLAGEKKDYPPFLPFATKWMFRERLLPRKIVPELHVVENMVRMYEELPNLRRIQKAFQLSQKVVKRVLSENGVKLVLDPRDKSLTRGFKPNFSAFTDFSDENTLYFYGLLLADGNLHKNTLSIVLHDKDRNILFPLSKYLGEGYKVHDHYHSGNLYARVDISHYKVTENLIAQGYGIAKSMKEKLPTAYDATYNMRHFWRGFLDGDGTIKYCNNTRNVRLLGSEEIINGFIDFVTTHAGCKPILPRKDKRVEGCFRVEYCGKQASEIAHLLYHNSTVALDRKKQHANKLMEYRGVDKTSFNKPMSNNSTGVCGVNLKYLNGRAVGYAVTWIDSISMKQRAKWFSFKKFGDEAKNLAISYREEMVRLHYNQ